MIHSIGITQKKSILTLMIYTVFSILFFFILTPNIVFAAVYVDGRIDLDFHANREVDGGGVILQQPDGKILLVDNLYRSDSLSVIFGKEIVRINLDGTIDSDFDSIPNIGTVVDDLSMYDNEKILITSGGDLLRLNEDGSLDSSFNVDNVTINAGGIRKGKIKRVAVQNDGKVLVAGFFSAIDGREHINIARLNTDGSLDQSFATTGGPSDDTNTQFVFSAMDISLHNDGTILVTWKRAGVHPYGTDFLISNFHPDGSLNENFGINGTRLLSSIPRGATTSGRIGRLVVLDNGDILVGLNGLFRLNREGDIDSGFGPTFSQSGGLVYDIKVQPDGKIIIGGLFAEIDGFVQSSIARAMIISGV